MLNFIEVYEGVAKYQKQTTHGRSQMQARKEFLTRKCLVNPDYIVAVYPHEFSSSTDQELLDRSSVLTHRGEEATEFSRIVLDGNSFRSSEMIVVGSMDSLSSSIETHYVYKYQG